LLSFPVQYFVITFDWENELHGYIQLINSDLDLEIPESELINLSELAIRPSPNELTYETLPRAMFPSSGGCDEHITIFLHQKRVPRSQLNSWTGKLTGLRDEHEKITLKLVPLEDLWKEGARDAKALGAWALYQGLKEEGKI
jgi:ADP-sugar diphosphatase